MGEIHSESGQKRRETLRGSELGARAARDRFGVVWSLADAAGLGDPRQSGGCWAAPRQQQFGQAGTGSPSFLQPAPRCGKGRFSPQNGSLVGQATLAPSPRQKRNPIPVLSAPLGFLRGVPGAWLLRFQRFHCLSPSFFHSFPPLLPSLPCVLAQGPPHGSAATATPLNGPRRRIIAISHLHSPSSQSSPAPPFSKSQLHRCAEPPGHPGMASARRAPEPGLA